ncbi:ribosomal-processing cysteine protease Prp [Aerococcaceae bacterium zg-ZJ1578]|uniref:ribosomal-processing cysteine protease Prp n=1 Tax=Aerococcaceae bacterium zg-252 TaxID=2796928 RepID=UPI001A34D0D5|nr:ribosomal-processing cysteine protease Prp [Aerococcaceae bacterium zg-1578]MBR7928423.1 ribosomal-processing cysteine protease Prp [Aerococcaceae bacterium zg-ZUI334]MBS4461191.1 ribosomal-processing cysteine protease Prp [Aerococcaceae bacterium zg-B36]
MIKVTFFRDKAEQLYAYELTGHAGYADNGYDIVCAAVSTQVISVENSLHKLIDVPVETVVNDVEGGYLKVTVQVIKDQHKQEQTQLLLEHLAFALEVIADSYSEFVKIQYK